MKFSPSATLALAAGTTTLAAGYVIPDHSASFAPMATTNKHTGNLLSTRQASGQALEQLKKMAPGSASCATAAQFKEECRTAEQAINPLLIGLYKYGVDTAPEQAAVVAWMTYESADFKYNEHHFGAVNPGQGTQCMMGPNFVAEYAASIPELAAQVKGKSPQETIQIVKDDKYSFAAASWFYSTKCDEATKTLVKAGGADGYEKFITGCVSTTMDEKRKEAWKLAMDALGQKTG